MMFPLYTRLIHFIDDERAELDEMADICKNVIILTGSII